MGEDHGDRSRRGAEGSGFGRPWQRPTLPHLHDAVPSALRGEGSAPYPVPNSDVKPCIAPELRHSLRHCGPRRCCCFQSDCGAATLPSPHPEFTLSTSSALPRAARISALRDASGSSSPASPPSCGIASSWAIGPCASTAMLRSDSDCSRAVVLAHDSGPTPV